MSNERPTAPPGPEIQAGFRCRRAMVPGVKIIYMIKGFVSAQLECLTSQGIRHSLFISEGDYELHLWEKDSLGQVIKMLEVRGVTINQRTEEKECYIIKF